MFALAHVILPFELSNPVEAIRASLAPFQRGGPDDLPSRYLAFMDETDRLRKVYETCCSFILHAYRDGDRLAVTPGELDTQVLDLRRIKAEMRRHGRRRWDVRFADITDLDTFFHRFGALLGRDARTGRYGRWLNPLAQWEYWDLGGRFDGWIAGGFNRPATRPPTRLSSSESINRQILRNLQAALEKALDQVSALTLDPDARTDSNIELVSTLLARGRFRREGDSLCVVVLPPGSVQDAWRWLAVWRSPKSREVLSWLGLPTDADWPAVVQAVYERFPNHWVAGVFFHLGRN